MFYSACLAHTACGNYYLRCVDKVYGSWLVTCDSNIKSAESDRIYALVHIGHCLFIETGIFVLVEYLRCLDSKWRIHIHRKIPMTRHHILRLDMPYNIQQFLSSAHCKWRYNKISSPIKGLLNDLCKTLCIVLRLIMATVTVCGLHYNIICLRYILRISDKRLVKVPYISRKYDLTFFTVLCEPYLDAWWAKQVTCVNKAYLYAIGYLRHLTVWVWAKASNSRLCVCHSIKWRHLACTLTFALSASPLCFKLLNMRWISQHYLT